MPKAKMTIIKGKSLVEGVTPAPWGIRCNKREGDFELIGLNGELILKGEVDGDAFEWGQSPDAAVLGMAPVMSRYYHAWCSVLLPALEEIGRNAIQYIDGEMSAKKFSDLVIEELAPVWEESKELIVWHDGLFEKVKEEMEDESHDR